MLVSGGSCTSVASSALGFDGIGRRLAPASLLSEAVDRRGRFAAAMTCTGPGSRFTRRDGRLLCQTSGVAVFLRVLVFFVRLRPFFLCAGAPSVISSIDRPVF